MTHLLWKYYWEDNVEKFRRLLSPAGHGGHQNANRNSPIIGGSGGGSPGQYGTSPRPTPKARKFQGPGHTAGGLSKSDVNSRDHAGLTILLRAASSTADNAISFVEALLEHPAIDIYASDSESGWNALHRALYAGNISIARMLLEKERKDLTGHHTSLNKVGQLIKTKDHEGNSPFDVYNSTIGQRILKQKVDISSMECEAEDDTDEAYDRVEETNSAGDHKALGEDLYAFGSNRNLSLGFGDEDDRQFPERVFLKRPDHLLQRFYNEYLEHIGADGPASQDLAKIPALTLNRPLIICDVILSKLHSAVLTADPVSNLYVCGVGRGGRLGLGDENTRFTYTPVQGPFVDRKVAEVALGQNHSMAVDSTGALWTWGSNAQSQLGYALPVPAKADEDPISTVPRQVFGPLKKEIVYGIAASAVHSVAHTGSSLYTWGKNLGQLALMDADSRSLEFQQTPRKVAASLFSSQIIMVSAIDKATTVLLQNHTVCVFTGYGYHIVKFPFASFDMIGNIRLSSRFEPGWNEINYITSGGDTIAALTKRGDLFTMSLDHKLEANTVATSTTNPTKLKSAVTPPQRIWNARKDGVRSVGVGEHGSVILSTNSGAVWRRIKRPKAKDAYARSTESKRNDFKFQRVPYITNVATVRASAYGAFAAIRQDLEVMKTQLAIDGQTLWKDVEPLNCLKGFKGTRDETEDDSTRKFFETGVVRNRLGDIAFEVLGSGDVEKDLMRHLITWSYRNDPLDAVVCVSSWPELRIPIHGWLLSARSSVLRSALAQFRRAGIYTHESFTISKDGEQAVVCFQDLDIYALLNLVLFAYEDRVVPLWNYQRHAGPLSHRYRQVRVEVMRLATRLDIQKLEVASRLQVDPQKCMDEDFRSALNDRRRFLGDGDVLLELDGAEVPAHSSFLCQRSPWFKGLFFGRSQGAWLAARRATQEPGERLRIDLKHMNPTAFNYALQYLYGDYGSELFNPAVCDTFEDFLDLVLEVMAVADYLMLDRLSQICQHVMGGFVNIRNASDFLNAISPCHVTEFKKAGLEYICLQLETMLENHFLDDLDERLLLELDKVVRENQAAQFPFVRSGRMELLLHENNPRLAEDIDEERHIRVKEMAYKIHREEEKRMAVSARTKFGSLDDSTPITPTPDIVRKASRVDRVELSSPDLRTKASQGDMMFDMDEDDASPMNSPSMRSRKSPNIVDHIPPLGSSLKAKGKKVWMSIDQSPTISHAALQTPPQPPLHSASPDVGTPIKTPLTPWGGAVAVQTPKLGLRDLFQSETPPQSALSAGLAAQKAKEAVPKASNKMSQKEKKRQQQEAQDAQMALLASKAEQPKNAWERAASEPQAAPWKVVPPKGQSPAPQPAKVQPKAIPSPSDDKGLLSPAAAATKTIPIHRRTASPDTRFSGQRSTPTAGAGASGSAPRQQTPKPGAAASTPSKPEPEKPLVPHSKNYIPVPRKAEPMLGFSMEDIIAQEARDKQSIKEAAAKRSLQEIQEEQAFQEWWDTESRRMQEEEARRLERERERVEGASSSGASKRGRGRGKGGRGGGSSNSQQQQQSSGGGEAAGGNAPEHKGPGRKSRGHGHGGNDAGGSGNTRGGGSSSNSRGGGAQSSRGRGRGRRDANSNSNSTPVDTASGGK
ncbi:BTB/POZ domain-containing protein 1 [Podospora australis]|uniref:BTB/POZ domain-containing protein 1 n=1 Tax=Podospora australis TaxID=1536484 RepID=A0AAN6WW75_9PEZI|nr:BTB/POZ domain-containing protein 1 [Podospora australis]